MQTFLENFSNEARDLAWAPDIEQRLMDYMNREQHRFRVRTVEWRMTRCALEVEAPYEFYVDDFLENRDFKDRIVPDIGDIGHEAGPGGEKIVVTISGYRRLCPH